MQQKRQLQYTYAAYLCDTSPVSTTFIIDSGASNHFVQENLETYMSNIKILDKYVYIHITNGEIMKSNKLGILHTKCHGHSINIEAMIVPGMKHNLLSVSKMVEKGHVITLEKEQATITAQNLYLCCKSEMGLYKLEMDKPQDKFSEANCNLVISDDRWHRRLGHAGKEALGKLGLPIPSKICDVCVEGKATRLPFKQNEGQSY